uniref:Uncharacterized protein n=1 Tax=Nelumbo nucifera TaxID=4432 RepID=A0A822Y1U5_NELNU|nr:TPA_asm: hypothetical protein HUJ06_026733 [Nelumbo nucifera]
MLSPALLIGPHRIENLYSFYPSRTRSCNLTPRFTHHLLGPYTFLLQRLITFLSSNWNLHTDPVFPSDTSQRAELLLHVGPTALSVPIHTPTLNKLNCSNEPKLLD